MIAEKPPSPPRNGESLHEIEPSADSRIAPRIISLQMISPPFASITISIPLSRISLAAISSLRLREVISLGTHALRLYPSTAAELAHLMEVEDVALIGEDKLTLPEVEELPTAESSPVSSDSPIPPTPFTSLIDMVDEEEREEAEKKKRKADERAQLDAEDVAKLVIRSAEGNIGPDTMKVKTPSSIKLPRLEAGGTLGPAQWQEGPLEWTRLTINRLRQ